MTRLAGLLWEVSGFDMSGRSPSRIIGFSSIGLTILVVPIRLKQTRLLDGASLGVFRIAAAPGLRVLGRQHPPASRPDRRWMHRATVLLPATWPLTGLALI
ncbi:MAG: hypothetical protein JO355_05230 [Planctomycetaceae bacterium]|jgi:hypothetical protein|nr:hypothetical protein [Planctomycetaceae bacterium]MBV8381461.1 hypothetical protein [Planctomycetaceae bacterium]MBV8554725.1 hypothetical protein [Planctomycetaceae bacterium]MBV8676558.1 hypothetical protein [Planctomycetaceae bacterium]